MAYFRLDGCKNVNLALAEISDTVFIVCGLILIATLIFLWLYMMYHYEVHVGVY